MNRAGWRLGSAFTCVAEEVPLSESLDCRAPSVSALACLLTVVLFGSVTATSLAQDLEPNDTLATASPISLNGSVSATLGYNNDAQDWYKLTTTADGSVAVTYTPGNGLTGQLSSYNFYNSSGTSLFDLTGIQPGTYYIQIVRGNCQCYGSYTLSTTFTAATLANDPEPNDTMATAVPLTMPSATVTGHLGFSNGHTSTITGDAQDWYKLTTTADGSVAVTYTPGNGLTGQLSSYNFYNSSGTSLISLGGIHAGTYYLQILSANSLCWGSYTLSVSFQGAAVPPSPTFAWTPTSPSAGQSVQFTDTSTGAPTSWAWNFGDGGTSTVQNPSHTYTGAGTYSVTLAASNTAGSNSITKQLIVVAATPTVTASFTWTPTSPSAGQSVQFTDTSTGAPTSWAWNFGDGGTSTVQNPAHTFMTAGTYSVTLTTSNSAGSNSLTRQLTVTAATPNVTASFTWTPNSPTAGQAVQFADTSTGAPTSWAWKFGDGGTAVVQNPSHTYAKAGTYAVTLTASKTAVANSMSKQITIAAPSCSDTCLSLTGTIRVRGTNVTIVGNNSVARQVRLIQNGQSTAFSTPIRPDGTYSLSVPSGTYQAAADLQYVDTIYNAQTATYTPKLRRALQTRSLSAQSGSLNLDFDFPPPIILIHGIESSPDKWTAWLKHLGVDADNPDAIKSESPDALVFTPSYNGLDALSTAAAHVASDLDTDFRIFATTPPYRVVGHSKGGLVARALNLYPIGTSMQALLFLGTPNGGSNCFTATAAGMWHLSWCDVQTFNDTAPALPPRTFAIAGTKWRLLDDVFSSYILPIVGSTVTCQFESGASDGVVPVDSVFKISTSNGATWLDGLVTPYNHTELGSASTEWMVNAIMWPFFDNQPFGGSADSLCRSAQFRTVSTSCTAPPRPSASGLCVNGRGFTGTCSVAKQATTTGGVKIVWEWVNSAISNVTASITGASSCDQATGTTLSYVSAAGDALLGYEIYRSATPISADNAGERIGFVDMAETSFVDPNPLPGINYYAVAAVTSTGNTAVSAAPPITVGGRRRAVPHS